MGRLGWSHYICKIQPQPKISVPACSVLTARVLLGVPAVNSFPVVSLRGHKPFWLPGSDPQDWHCQGSVCSTLPSDPPQTQPGMNFKLCSCPAQTASNPWTSTWQHQPGAGLCELKAIYYHLPQISACWSGRKPNLSVALPKPPRARFGVRAGGAV